GPAIDARPGGAIGAQEAAALAGGPDVVGRGAPDAAEVFAGGLPRLAPGGAVPAQHAPVAADGPHVPGNGAPDAVERIHARPGGGRDGPVGAAPQQHRAAVAHRPHLVI